MTVKFFLSGGDGDGDGEYFLSGGDGDGEYFFSGGDGDAEYFFVIEQYKSQVSKNRNQFDNLPPLQDERRHPPGPQVRRVPSLEKKVSARSREQQLL